MTKVFAKIKTEVDPIKVVFVGEDPLGGKFYRVSSDDFYTMFNVDGDTVDTMQSPLGGIDLENMIEYGKFLKKAFKALYEELPSYVEQ